MDAQEMQSQLSEWYVIQDQLKSLKAKELELRKVIFAHYFPDPKEGTNTVALADGYELKGKYSITRDVDIAAFTASRQAYIDAGICADAMVKFAASLVTTEYLKLNESAQKLFDQCLIIKPGAPSLEIVLPKKAKSDAVNIEQATALGKVE